MKVFSLVVLFISVIILGGCKKKEVNPLCLDGAIEILKKDSTTFFKGSIFIAKVEGKTILVIRNSENGAGTILDGSCNTLYSCCGHLCDCSVPVWINKIKYKEVIWEVK